MSSYMPIYQDAKMTKLYRMGQLPFYILHNIIKLRSPLHHHDFAEMSLVVDGRGTEKIHGKSHEMRRGTVSFLLPHHIHEIRSVPEAPIVLYSCMFDLAILANPEHEKEFTGDLLQIGSELPSFCQLNEEQTNQMEQLMISIKQEYAGDQYGRDVLLRTKLTEALIVMIRCFKQHQPPSIPADRQVRRHIGELLQYVHQHYNEQFNLNDISKLFNISTTSISRTFKQFTGQNLTNYLHSLRISRALSLLASTKMTIIDISEEVGFQHIRSFSRVFKEMTGTTPKQYRQQIRESE